MGESVDVAPNDRLFQDSRIPTLTLDLARRQILAANPAAEEFLGLGADEVIGRPASDLLAVPAPDQALREWSRARGSTRLIRDISTSEGVRTAEISISPTSQDEVVFVQAFDITDLIVAVRDGEAATTELHRLRDALVGLSSAYGPDASPDGLRRELAAIASSDEPATPRETPITHVSTSELGHLFDVSPIAAGAVDLVSGQVVRVNSRLQQLLEIPARAVEGRQLHELVTDPDAVARAFTEMQHEARGATQCIATELLAAHARVPVEIQLVALSSTPLAIVQFVESRARTGRASVPRLPRSRRDHGLARAGPTAVAPHPGRIRDVCAGLLITLGAVVLVIGWWAGFDSVTRIAPGLASMKANTALGFVALGVALAFGGPSREPRGRSAALAIVFVLGAFTAAEYVAGIDLRVDELLVSDTILTATSSPGRMGFNTAISFVLLSVGMFLADGSRSRRAMVAGQLALLTGAALALLALMAYTFGASGGRGLASSTEMALHTSVGVIVAVLGALATTTHAGVLSPLGAPLAGGRFARRVLPLGVGAVIGSSLLVRALAAADILPDRDFELAFDTLLITISLIVVILVIADSSNELDSITEQARRDLATVQAAFSDRHYRVDPSEVARQVTGAGSSPAVPVDSLVPPSVRHRLQMAVERTRVEQRGTEVSFADGDGRQLELRVAPLPGEDVAISIRDVSELAAARDALTELTASLEHEVRDRTEELHQTNAELARSNGDLEQFAYLASHDLQEPLRMVSTFVTKLADRMGDDLDDRSRSYVGFAVDGADRMSSLIDGLLEYARVGRDQPDLTTVALDTTVAEVLQTLDRRIAETGADVTITEPLLPVLADEVFLRQILQNLLSNALKFVHPDRRPHIEVATRRTAGSGLVELAVSDNGIGVPAEFRQEIFHMFRRLHGRSQYPGTGIGLSLVARLVEAQGGTVGLDPDHGPHGTSFVVRLPSAPVSER